MSANALEIHNPSDVDEYRPDPFIQMIERVVLDPQASVEKLEHMLALRNQAEDRARQHAREDAEIASKRAYFKAMSACQSELPVVVKNKANDHTKSNYADLAAIEEQAMPVIHKHGFAVSFQPDGYNERGELRILWEISHEEGHARNGVGEIPVDGAGSQGKVNKTGTQAFGSTATYGRRYLLCMLFNISTGDDRDGNRVEDTSATITAEQRDELQSLIETLGWDVPGFCEWAKIDALPDLEARHFPKAKQLIETKIRMKGEAQ